MLALNSSNVLDTFVHWVASSEGTLTHISSKSAAACHFDGYVVPSLDFLDSLSRSLSSSNALAIHVNSLPRHLLSCRRRHLTYCLLIRIVWRHTTTALVGKEHDLIITPSVTDTSQYTPATNTCTCHNRLAYPVDLNLFLRSLIRFSLCKALPWCSAQWAAVLIAHNH
jgi:hypothetical protein